MRIAFLVTPNMLVTSFANAFELLYAARQMADVKLREGGTLPPLNGPLTLHKVANSPQRITMPSGLTMQADIGLTMEAYDLVYLPALWRNPRPVMQRNPEIIAWVRWQHEHGAIINSTGTGVWFSAAAGILDGKPATTHWYFLEKFAKDFPQVQLKRQHFITSAGNIYCAASVNALTDLTLHHVHRIFGRDVADQLSHHFSHEVRQPFDRLSFNEDLNTNHPDEQILQVQLWMQTNYNRADYSLRRLAKMFSMSERNLSRRFKIASNVTPGEYLQTCRVEAAQELLKTSNLSIKEIAYRVGYLDVSYFTRMFRQHCGLTPAKYRASLRAKLFSSATSVEA